jgi:hypothetical protein
MESRKIHAYSAAQNNSRDIVVVEDETSDEASESGRCDTTNITENSTPNFGFKTRLSPVHATTFRRLLIHLLNVRRMAGQKSPMRFGGFPPQCCLRRS